MEALAHADRLLHVSVVLRAGHCGLLPISRAHASSRSVSATRLNVSRSSASSTKHDPVESNKSCIEKFVGIARTRAFIFSSRLYIKIEGIARHKMNPVEKRAIWTIKNTREMHVKRHAASALVLLRRLDELYRGFIYRAG